MRRHDLRRFDPKLYAHLDGAMWRAYYHHNFGNLFLLLIRLNYHYFRPSARHAIKGAYYSARAAIVFRKTKGKEDLATIESYLEKYFKLLSDGNVSPFDYQLASKQELKWWMIDRYPQKYRATRADGLANAMAAIYNLESRTLMEYGRNRASAMELLGAFHHDIRTDVDWSKLEDYLKKAYSSLHSTVNPGALC